MKHRYLAFLLSTIASTPVFAAPVVMVQFGSFETQQEAQKRLDDLKTANGNILGAVSPSVKEVKLPPDNLTVYRTQAGPLESRTAAQSLCNQLASTGSECYVVETAVSTGTPSAPTAAAVTPTPVATALPALKSPEQLGSITPVSSAADASTPAMQSALSRAAAQQDSGEVASAPPVSAPSEKPTFWSRLNPFSTTPAAKPPAPKPVAVVEKLPVSAPVTEVTSAPIAPAVATSFASAPAVAAAAVTPAPVLTAPVAPLALTAPAPLLNTPAPAPLVAPAPVIAAVPTPIIPVAPVVAPAPLVAAAPIATPAPVTLANPTNFRPRFASSSTKDRAAAETQSLPQLSVVSESAPLVASAPAPITPLAPTRLASSAPAAAGDVRVEEAKRVPVTESFRPRMRPAPERNALQPQYQLAAKTAAIPAANLLPSSTTGVRTYWAQVGHFANSQAALEFWNSYRNAHPDFPAQRIRVVSALQSERHGKEEVSLRVGPFAREAFIETLCGSLGKTNTLSCGGITDVGIAAKTTANQQGYLQGSRYKR